MDKLQKSCEILIQTYNSFQTLWTSRHSWNDILLRQNIWLNTPLRLSKYIYVTESMLIFQNFLSPNIPYI